jgi:hypothetical protein
VTVLVLSYAISQQIKQNTLVFGVENSKARELNSIAQQTPDKCSTDGVKPGFYAFGVPCLRGKAPPFPTA